MYSVSSTSKKIAKKVIRCKLNHWLRSCGQNALGNHAHDVSVVDSHGNKCHLVKNAFVGQAQEGRFVDGKGAENRLLQLIAEGGRIKDAAGVLMDETGLVAHHEFALRIYDVGVHLTVQQQAGAEQCAQGIGVVGAGKHPDHLTVHTALVDGHCVPVHIAAQRFVPEGGGDGAFAGESLLHRFVLLRSCSSWALPSSRTKLPCPALKAGEV